jgi:TetR/AcrR family transcriptional regulator
MGRPARVSPDRILASAALEFAERGFAGARVDRIARRARVNKAMLYYHFKSKQHLYHTLLRHLFARAAERLHAIAASDAPAAEKIDQAIAGIATFIEEHASFPSIMLREVAEGGAHLDRDTIRTLAAVPRAFGAIVQQGIESGTFRPVNPMFAYFGLVPPIAMFLAGAPIRREIARLHVIDGAALSPGAFVSYMQGAARQMLAAGPAAPKRARR